MAKLQPVLLKANLKGLDNAKTMMEVLNSKANRLQHLFNEIYAGLIDLENEMNNISITLEPVEQEDDNNKQQRSSSQQGLSGLAKEEERTSRQTEDARQPTAEELNTREAP